MKPKFTSDDANRLLQLADQFLTDWEEVAHEGRDPEDIEEVWQRRREWDAIRPILVAAPAMLREDIADGELGDKLRTALAAAVVPSNEVMKLTSSHDGKEGA